MPPRWNSAAGEALIAAGELVPEFYDEVVGYYRERLDVTHIPPMETVTLMNGCGEVCAEIQTVRTPLPDGVFPRTERRLRWVHRPLV